MENPKIRKNIVTSILTIFFHFSSPLVFGEEEKKLKEFKGCICVLDSVKNRLFIEYKDPYSKKYVLEKGRWFQYLPNTPITGLFGSNSTMSQLDKKSIKMRRLRLVIPGKGHEYIDFDIERPEHLISERCIVSYDPKDKEGFAQKFALFESQSTLLYKLKNEPNVNYTYDGGCECKSKKSSLQKMLIFEDDHLGCELGIGNSCLNIGLMYFRGKTVKRDRKKSIDYFLKACKRGSGKGCGNWYVMTH